MADLACLLCGAPVGSIESSRPNLPPQAVFRAVGIDQPSAVEDWRRLRCGRCGGATIVEEIHTVERFVESPEALTERPRRGRPSKRMLEERRLAQERLQALAG